MRAQDTGWLAWMAVLVCVAGCGERSIWVDARIRLNRPMASTCQVSDDDALTIRALGDFPPSEQTITLIDPADGSASLDQFPIDTRYLSVAVGTTDPTAGGAVAMPSTDSDRQLLLLPLERSCPSPDFDARARMGAAITALPDGGLLIAGGRNDDLVGAEQGPAVSSAAILPAGSELVEPVIGGMFLRRSGATATLLGDRVLVVGGGAHDRGPAHDTYEWLDLATRRFSAKAGETLVAGPRRDHAAIPWADGSAALIAGGVSEIGASPMSSIERIDASGAAHVADLAVPRAGLAMHALSDASVVIVGGTDDAGNVVRTVERLEPDTQSIETLAITLPAARHGVSASLLGDRIAWIGCDAQACRVSLLLFGDHTPSIQASLVALPALVRVQALGLSDGALLVIGTRGLSQLAQAWRVDLGRNLVQTLSASRPATHLVALTDGTTAELDDAGLSLRRDRIATPFDNPPDALLSDDRELALDAANHWSRTPATLVALEDDARVDLAGMWFADLRLTLDVDAQDDQRLTTRLSAGTQGASLVITATDLALGPCTLARSATDAPVTIERRGNHVDLIDGANTARCSAELPEHVSLSWLASAGVTLGPIRIERL